MHDDGHAREHLQVQRVHGTLVDSCLKTFYTTPKQVVDDFAIAQSTPLPECITGVEGDKVRACRPPQPSSLKP